MKKILLPTDFSDNAWNAISYALAFYKNIPVTYILTHIATSDSRFFIKEKTYSCTTDTDVIEANSEIGKLNALKKRIQEYSNLKKTQVQVEYLEGNFTNGIKTVASKYEIDLIVMGTKGVSGSLHKMVGGHTSAVITKIKHPLMVIPEAATFLVPLNIAFPTDYDFIYKAKVLNTLSEIVNVHHSNLNVLRVANSKLSLSLFQQKNRAYLKDFLKDSSASFHRVDQQELEKDIQSFIDSMHIDMIAMVAKNLNFFQKLLFNPKVAKMPYHINVPFLVLHE